MLTSDGAKAMNDARWKSPKAIDARAEKHLAAIEALVAAAPPMTPTMKARLRALLAGQGGAA